MHFHRALKAVCDRHQPAFYPRFKSWCDHYFVNTHRGDERRGIGGIFFDNLRDGDSGLDLDRLVAFQQDVGGVLPAAYGPIVERRRDLPYGERERRLQLARRGRYVEFNLVHDRGTMFGLQTNARIESVLMSLPPLAAWEYAPVYEPGSFEAELMAMLEPRDWAEAGRTRPRAVTDQGPCDGSVRRESAARGTDTSTTSAPSRSPGARASARGTRRAPPRPAPARSRSSACRRTAPRRCR